MKRLLAVSISLVLMFTLCSCSFFEKSENIVFSAEVEAILDELGEETVVSDFREIFNILTNLSSKEKEFLAQLEDARAIAEQYGFSLESADYFFLPASLVSAETIKRYIEERCYHDVGIALDAMIEPLLFDMYGDDVQHIREISKQDVLQGLQSSEYYCKEKEDVGNNQTEEVWYDYWGVTNDITVKYYDNSLVYSVKVPVISDVLVYETEEDWQNFYKKSSEEQEKITKEAVDVALESFNGFTTAKNVLSTIYLDEEISELENFIKNLNADYIWENNGFGTDEESVHLSSALLCTIYKDTQIWLSVGAGSITLTVFGVNAVNEYTSRYYTLLCYFTNLDESDYSVYINNDVSANEEISDYFVDFYNEEK